jgi:hypothetical protein
MTEKSKNQKPKLIIRNDSATPIQKNRIYGNVSQESFDKPIIRDRIEPPPPPTPKKR